MTKRRGGPKDRFPLSLLDGAEGPSGLQGRNLSTGGCAGERPKPNPARPYPATSRTPAVWRAGELSTPAGGRLGAPAATAERALLPSASVALARPRMGNCPSHQARLRGPAPHVPAPRPAHRRRRSLLGASRRTPSPPTPPRLGARDGHAALQGGADGRQGKQG